MDNTVWEANFAKNSFDVAQFDLGIFESDLEIFLVMW